MKILLTGKNGQVGFELQRALAPIGDVTAVGHAECDLADPDAIRRLIRDLNPDLIVNPAAYTAVDLAESNEAAAIAVNALAPGVLGSEAARIGACVIHYSTDYVFDGTKQSPYDEEDATNPLGVYGRTKVAGERALAAATERYFVLRTSWVVGAHGGNFLKTILRLAAERDQLSIVADQHGAPTSAALIADVTAHMAQQYKRRASSNADYGTYHVAAAGATTWYEYSRFIVQEAVKRGVKLKLDPEKIRPIPTADYPLPAKRPANSRLDTSRVQQTFGLRLPGWEEGVRRILSQMM